MNDELMIMMTVTSLRQRGAVILAVYSSHQEVPKSTCRYPAVILVLSGEKWMPIWSVTVQIFLSRLWTAQRQWLSVTARRTSPTAVGLATIPASHTPIFGLWWSVRI